MANGLIKAIVPTIKVQLTKTLVNNSPNVSLLIPFLLISSSKINSGTAPKGANIVRAINMVGKPVDFAKFIVEATTDWETKYIPNTDKTATKR